MYIWYYYLAGLQIIAFFLFALDKLLARHKKWRISENTLLLSALFGGSIGALASMYLFRHKTRHKKFTWGIPLILILQFLLFFAVKFYW